MKNIVLSRFLRFLVLVSVFGVAPLSAMQPNSHVVEQEAFSSGSPESKRLLAYREQVLMGREGALLQAFGGEKTNGALLCKKIQDEFGHDAYKNLILQGKEPSKGMKEMFDSATIHDEIFFMIMAKTFEALVDVLTLESSDNSYLSKNIQKYFGNVKMLNLVSGNIIKHISKKYSYAINGSVKKGVIFLIIEMLAKEINGQNLSCIEVNSYCVAMDEMKEPSMLSMSMSLTEEMKTNGLTQEATVKADDGATKVQAEKELKIKRNQKIERCLSALSIMSCSITFGYMIAVLLQDSF